MTRETYEPAARRLQLARHPRSAGEARRFVGGLLEQRCCSDETRDCAVLVSSELVTNAFQHGVGGIELRLNLLDDRVRIEVVDEGRGEAPAVREEAPHAVGGWGLHIVDELSLQWGVYEGTTHVWADLARG